MGPVNDGLVGSQPQTLTTSGFRSGRALASCIHAPAWCCCCHGNCAVGTQPISSFSNAVNSQLNADALSKKIIRNRPILMKLYRHVLGVRFLNQNLSKFDVTKGHLSDKTIINTIPTVLYD